MSQNSGLYDLRTADFMKVSKRCRGVGCRGPRLSCHARVAAHATCRCAPVNAASVEIRRRIRRLNDSGRIGDVRGESALPSIPDELLHCREPSGRAMCGRLRVGKENLHVAGRVGAAMCSAFWCGSHDRWP
jgi:hypothetical protein